MLRLRQKGSSQTAMGSAMVMATLRSLSVLLTELALGKGTLKCGSQSSCQAVPMGQVWRAGPSPTPPLPHPSPAADSAMLTY